LTRRSTRSRAPAPPRSPAATSATTTRTCCSPAPWPATTISASSGRPRSAARDRLSPGTYQDTRIERHLAHFAPAGEDAPDGILYAEARPQGRPYRFRKPLMQPYVILQGVSSGRVTREMLA
jgi:hypothetical protein